jgi:four helix bundle protein
MAKIGIVVEEADETVFWLELLEETGIVNHLDIHELRNEANQLLAIFAASQRTVRSNNVSMKK